VALTDRQKEINEDIAQQIKGTQPTPQSVRAKNLNPRPETPLDISQNLIEVKAGRQRLSKEMEDVYKVNQYIFNDKGKVVGTKKVEGWGLNTTLTNDLRLSNLNVVELEYVRWATKVHGFCVLAGLSGSAWTSNWLSLSVTESSLAKDMALRKILQTMKQESQHVQIEQQKPKTNLFGFMNK
jgi:hypothetical protein